MKKILKQAEPIQITIFFKHLERDLKHKQLTPYIKNIENV